MLTCLYSMTKLDCGINFFLSAPLWGKYIIIHHSKQLGIQIGELKRVVQVLDLVSSDKIWPHASAICCLFTMKGVFTQRG